jgi:CCR4-NOT transcription complex subunit 1
LEPCLRSGQLNDTVRLLYKGSLRILLVLLHDFPEFLCEYHFALCDAIPASCIQLRNLILSAFPRNMRLPDPFTPNLKVSVFLLFGILTPSSSLVFEIKLQVDLLPEIFESPRIMSSVAQIIGQREIKDELDNWIKTHSPSHFLQTLPQKLLLPAQEARLLGTRYSVQTINSLVLYVGMQAISMMQNQRGMLAPPFTQTFAVEIYQHLVNELDAEGTY